MNYKNTIKILIFIFFGFFGCHFLFGKDDEEPTLKYLTEYEMVSSYP